MLEIGANTRHKALGDFSEHGDARKVLREMTAKCADFVKILTPE
ncbi:hypothetical protein [Burkholderia ambifaria]|jgi:hypothetical protein|nr:hypothetical protein [Burkholderia ambifaria]